MGIVVWPGIALEHTVGSINLVTTVVGCRGAKIGPFDFLLPLVYGLPF